MKSVVIFEKERFRFRVFRVYGSDSTGVLINCTSALDIWRCPESPKLWTRGGVLIVRGIRRITRTIGYHPFLYEVIYRIPCVYDAYYRIQLLREVSVSPPQSKKHRIVREYAKLFSIRVFVETGTYRGDMVNSVKSVFKRIYSIELDKTLFERARARFSKYSHITIMHGDSGEVLPEILVGLAEPTLFWLDAHCSGGRTVKGILETAITGELQEILAHPIRDHVVLIDDARYFDGGHDYPTLQWLKDFVHGKRPDLSFKVENDIIHIYPPS